MMMIEPHVSGVMTARHGMVRCPLCGMSSTLGADGQPDSQLLRVEMVDGRCVNHVWVTGARR